MMHTIRIKEHWPTAEDDEQNTVSNAILTAFDATYPDCWSWLDPDHIEIRMLDGREIIVPLREKAREADRIVVEIDGAEVMER